MRNEEIGSYQQARRPPSRMRAQPASATRLAQALLRVRWLRLASTDSTLRLRNPHLPFEHQKQSVNMIQPRHGVLLMC